MEDLYVHELKDWNCRGVCREKMMGKIRFSKIVETAGKPSVHLLWVEPNPDIAEIKNQVRHAMKILEEGKQVAAFHLLQRIVNS